MDYQMHQRILLWLEEAADRLRNSFKETIQVNEKTSARDLVTEMDRAIEAFLIDKIRQNYPQDRILCEEGQGDHCEDSQGRIWVIDPIDGTMNFVKAKNNFGIMIGIYQDGQPIAGYISDVMQHNIYYGIVGDGVYVNNQLLKTLPITSLADSIIIGNIDNFCQNVYNMQALLNASLGARAYGAAAMEIISLIRGEVALYITINPGPWDFAAGYAICEAMGYKVSTLSGERPNILKRSPILYSHPNVYEEALSLLKHED